jgi:hypothetical protein
MSLAGTKRTGRPGLTMPIHLQGSYGVAIAWGFHRSGLRGWQSSSLIGVVNGSPKPYTLCVRHPIDISIMFAALWLLGSMVLDYLTPKELTVYMIAAATAPAVIDTGLSYYLRFPMIDFVLILATLWLVAALTLEWISPVPLPGFMIGAAVAPALIVGAILHWHRYRSRQRSG